MSQREDVPLKHRLLNTQNDQTEDSQEVEGPTRYNGEVNHTSEATAHDDEEPGQRCL